MNEHRTLWPAPHPTGPVRATVRLPGSKSITNRALVLAALSDGPSVVRQALRSRDTRLMAEALTELGVGVDTTGADWKVTPGRLRGRETIDCGLAGTVMRFVPPVAALADGPVVFDGDPHARLRPMHEILQGLRGLGVEVEDEDRGALPFTVVGTGSVRGGRVTIDASASSQFISALLLAGARYDEGVDVRHEGKPVPSLPHIDMTVEQLRLRGVDVDDSDVNRWRVLPSTIRAVDVQVEPDLSNAAPFLAAGLVTGGQVTVLDWPRTTTQAGDALREIIDADGRQHRAHRRGPDRDRHGHPARARPRPARRRRADPRRRCALPAGRLPVAPARDRAHPRARDRPAHRAGHRVQLDGRARDRDRGRPHDPARGAPRRRVPHLRRPPDGARRRHPRARGPRRRASRTSRTTSKTFPDFPGAWSAFLGSSR